MRAAHSFLSQLLSDGNVAEVGRVQIELYGSLALTGAGHGTDHAVLAGLAGMLPDQTGPEQMREVVRSAEEGALTLSGGHRIAFARERDLLFHKGQMYPDQGIATHPNGVRFTAFREGGERIAEEVFYSVGGGFVVPAAEFGKAPNQAPAAVPFAFSSAAELLSMLRERSMPIHEAVLQNEIALLDSPGIPRPKTDATLLPPRRVEQGVLALWSVMNDCIERGLATEGILPGGLNVRRRAPRLAARLREKGSSDPLAPLDWITVFAMAVNEENAAGGRVVTAPTNGAAGVVPAVGRYYLDFVAGADTQGLLRYLFTAAAIGILYKENASISGAEVGCQGEVGVACSMAAGALVAAQGGTNGEVEHAAEIGMEHNLGMTCDPIGGLVQIPCIERNGMAAVKAVNAARMAMNESESHKVSLDQVIRTMYQTGLDMQSRYKETSLAGLALSVIEC